jgi:hypothetical protein
MVLEAEKSNVRVPASGRGLVSVSHLIGRHQMAEGLERAGGPTYSGNGISPFMRAEPCLWLNINTSLGGDRHSDHSRRN